MRRRFIGLWRHAGGLPSGDSGARVKMTFLRGCDVSTLLRSGGLPMSIGLLMLCLFAACQNGNISAPSVPAVSQTQDSDDKPLSGVGSVLGPVPDVRPLEKYATLIVKGRVLDVRTVGTTEMRGQKTRDLAASIQVDSVLKGKVEGGTITIRHPKDPLPFGIQLRAGEYALYFLRDGQGGVYTFVNSMTAKMDITSRKVPLADAARTPIEKLKVELFASLSDPAPEVAKTALQQVDRLGRKSSAESLQRIAASRAPENEGMAYAGLIYLRDYSLLRQAIQFAEAPTTDPNVQYWESRIAASIGVIGDNRMRQALEATKYMQEVTCASTILAKQPLDSSVLPRLYPLLSSPNVELRRGAAHALRGICDSSSVPVLAQALNDSDRTVQYDAMMGLAALENFPEEKGTPVR
jgi:hypothetical protein